ncbi:hypothetical protein U1Q18_004805 [Sarracenia purpurea var. burkii]
MLPQSKSAVEELPQPNSVQFLFASWSAIAKMWFWRLWPGVGLVMEFWPSAVFAFSFTVAKVYRRVFVLLMSDAQFWVNAAIVLDSQGVLLNFGWIFWGLVFGSVSAVIVLGPQGAPGFCPWPSKPPYLLP